MTAWEGEHRAACLEWGTFAIGLGFSLIGLHTIRETGSCTCGRETCAKGKHPLWSGWRNPDKQLRTEAELLRLLDAGSVVNLGLVTGTPSGVAVIDVDVTADKAGDVNLERYEAERPEGPLPPTLTVRTGSGGLHLIYAVPQDCHVGNSAGQWLPGVDVRGDGGYSVWPPSRHHSGRHYTLVEGRPAVPAPLPDDVLQELRRGGGREQGRRKKLAQLRSVANPTAYADAALESAARKLALTPQGSRNVTLNNAAYGLGMMVGLRMISLDTVAGTLGRAAVVAGLAEGRVRATLRSGLVSGAAQVGVEARAAAELAIARWAS